MHSAEIVTLSHDLLVGKVQMSVAFKNLNGATIEQIDIQFKMKAAARETETEVKAHAIAMAKSLLKRAYESI